jgi:hypothetical protein
VGNLLRRDKAPFVDPAGAPAKLRVVAGNLTAHFRPPNPGRFLSEIGQHSFSTQAYRKHTRMPWSRAALPLRPPHSAIRIVRRGFHVQRLQNRKKSCSPEGRKCRAMPRRFTPSCYFRGARLVSDVIECQRDWNKSGNVPPRHPSRGGRNANRAEAPIPARYRA